MIDMCLSDSDYTFEELETSEDSSSDYSDEGIKEKYPSFVMPKKLLDYKWVLGTMFTINEDFKEAIANYVVNNGRDFHFIKNYKTMVIVGCKEGCELVALCSKFLNKDAWHLIKLIDTHSCKIGSLM
ncbi:unnamed protein product [Lathyrus sativus]|nr:unnamed protein product [Lathyrus sativus]